ncbi:MAG: GntR family transcriptional regulator [Candidatus Adiutrix sp.]|jgi:GntR family transcriptional regulator|nr:GntR family transcriptional regulator [Candidatus Adiutrix sp.]
MIAAKPRISSQDIDKSAGRPVYQQVAALLKSEIASENWPPGHKIPSEPDLARRLKLSVLTVRQAIGQLVEEGLLTRARGRGTFVVGLDWNQLTFSLNMATSLLQRNDQLKMKFLTMRMVRVERELAGAMEIEPGSKVISLRRLLLLSGQPYLLQHSLLRPVPSLPVVESDLVLAVTADFFTTGQNLRLKKAQVALKAETAAGEDAALLALEPGQPVFRLEYRYFDFTDRPLGCGWLLLPSGHLTFESNLGLWG